MLEDKKRWNEKYLVAPMPAATAAIVKDNIAASKPGRALDIACGTGRNTHFLADKGFMVDAVDFSDYALDQVQERENIRKIDADLDSYTLETDAYALVVNINYLDRQMFAPIIQALKKEGILIYETFMQTQEGEDYHNPSNPDFLLAHNELLDAFSALEIVLYTEKDAINLRGEKVKIASLVAKKL